MASNRRLYGWNIYNEWVSSGKIGKILSFIRECSKKLITHKEMCRRLGINASTFSEMKKKHLEIKKAMDDSKYDLKLDLASAMYKRAMGYEVVEEDQLIEEKDGKQKKKIHRVKNQVGPDYKSIVYLLTKHLCKEYSQNHEERKIDGKEVVNRDGSIMLVFLSGKEITIEAGE